MKNSIPVLSMILWLLASPLHAADSKGAAFSNTFNAMTTDLREATIRLDDLVQRILPNNATTRLLSDVNFFQYAVTRRDHPTVGRYIKRELIYTLNDVLNFMNRYKYQIPVDYWNAYVRRYNEVSDFVKLLQSRARYEVENYDYL